MGHGALVSAGHIGGIAVAQGGVDQVLGIEQPGAHTFLPGQGGGGVHEQPFDLVGGQVGLGVQQQGDGARDHGRGGRGARGQEVGVVARRRLTPMVWMTCSL